MVRRSILVLSVLILFLAGRACWWEPSSLIIQEEELRLPWPAPAGPRIAVLSDLHVGSPFNGLDNLRATVERTNAAQPDIICLLGDYVIQGVVGGSFVTPEEIAPVLADLKAPGGVFAVLGNHDAWLDHARVLKALTGNGIRVIEDTSVSTQTPAGRITIAGVSDLWTRSHDIKAALRDAPAAGEPVLLITHNPDVFPEVPERVTLTLAGHTHGGQVALPFIGRPIVPSAFGQRFAAGHIVERGRHLYVATGIGTSIIPVRLRVRPAVTVLRITPQ